MMKMMKINIPYNLHTGCIRLTHRIGCLVLWVWCMTHNANAQFYASGTEPTSVRWQQINTEHFRIIFPKGASADGQRAANMLEYIRRADGKTLDHYPGKIPVVLHNRTAFSNGFVSWAPKRSEWYMTPPQDSYAQHWPDQLAVHEYRHVVQIDKLNQGFTRVMGYAIGQQATGAVAGLIPRWFLEGDAVAAETAMTHAGRGRNPAFEMPLRTIALSEGAHKYDKAMFGSYRDHVPNHYELGYQMVAWTREKYSAETFESAVRLTAREPYLFFLYPFRLGLKRETGYATGKLYRRAFDDLTQRWSEQEAQTQYRSGTPLTVHTSRLYTSYRSPQYMNDSCVVAQKTGMAQITQWVQVNRNGTETVLHTPGLTNSDRISLAGSRLVWTEQIDDVRWSNRSYSVVKMYDTQTKRERTLGRKTRYYSPALSPDGKTISVVEVPVEGACDIVLLDAETGAVKDRILNPDNRADNPVAQKGDYGRHIFIQTPVWSRNGKSLIAIANNMGRKSIVRVEVATGNFSTVLPPVAADISNPVDGGRYVFFTGYYNGITNVYAVDCRTWEVFQVTSSRFGAFDPYPDAAGSKLVYAEYAAGGYQLVETALDTSQWTPIAELKDHSLKLYETLARQEAFNMQDSIVPAKQHPVKKYSKLAHLFNIHSWAPLYYEVNATDITSTKLYPGIVLLSQDLLGNLTSSAGYSWRGYNAFHASFTYTGLYPVFNVNIDYGGQQTVAGTPEGDGNRDVDFRRKATQLGVQSYIPFTLTRSRWITGFTPQVGFSYNNSYIYSPETDSYQHGLHEMTYSFQAYRYLKMSVRDLFPRLGLVVQGAYRHTPWQSPQLLGHIYCMYGRIYLPGVARHHSLQLSGALQEQKTAYYLFTPMVNFPRGYINGRTERMSIATVDYALPLAYPDWNCSFLVYLKRLRTNLFCDVADNRYRHSRSTQQRDRLLSVGVDLLADVNLLRINFPVNIGIRTVYVPEMKSVQPSILFDVSFQ